MNSGVYFIQAGKSGPIKIGFSDDVSKRIASLQTGNADTLNLRLVVPGTMETEADLHRRFASARIRPSGEWFATTRELLEFMGQTPNEDGEGQPRDRFTRAQFALKDCIIAWNPARPWVAEPTAIAVGPNQDDDPNPNPMSHWSYGFVMWTRAGRWADGLGAAHEWTFETAKAWLFMTFAHIVVRDGVPAAEVHREFLKIEEYRDGLSDDMPGIGCPLSEVH